MLSHLGGNRSGSLGRLLKVGQAANAAAVIAHLVRLYVRLSLDPGAVIAHRLSTPKEGLMQTATTDRQTAYQAALRDLAEQIALQRQLVARAAAPLAAR